MTDALTAINTRKTDQRTKARADQVQNNAGGFVFSVSNDTRLRRFLILGTTGGTYYQGEAELTRENADVVIDAATNNTKALVDLVVEISLAGRAPKQNPSIFALAAAAGLGDAEGRKYALDSLSKVARTGTHLFLFATYVEQFRGWGRGLRNAVGSWYNDKPVDKLAYQAVKYRQRNGWSHRDLLRLSHPVTNDVARKNLYGWITKGTTENVPGLVEGFLAAQSATSVDAWANLVLQHKLSWEMLPDAALKEAAVWEALLENGLPQTALMRQLPRLTNLGLLKGATLKKVTAQLSNQDALTKSRVHPMNVLTAQYTYAGGHSLKGSTTWTPVTKIVDALDAAFYASFGNVEAANKRTMNALDVSGSMGSWGWGALHNAGVLTPRNVSAAMSLVTVATEPDVLTVGFTGGGYSWGGYGRRKAVSSEPLTVLNISARQRLDDVVKTISGLPFGSTDCALPMVYAKEKSLEIDTFVVWTDNETWAGNIQPFQALKQYRAASGIDAKLIVCGVTATDFSIADPSDAGMLDVVGFDSAVPNLIADFSAGRI